MFGHNSLNYGNIHTLLNAETRTFRAGTEANWDYDGELYTIEPTGEDGYAGLTSPSGDDLGNYGNADMTWAEQVAAAINAIPQGGIYRLSGFSESQGVDNSSTTNPNPPSCASENREDGATEDVCGDCLSGYTEDDTGTCVADVEEIEEGTNWMLYGGIAVVVIGGVFMVSRK
jgi:hypothetical protein